MTDPFRGPMRKIASAKRHFDTMDDLLGEFWKTKPMADIFEPHENGTHTICKVAMVKPFPEEIEECIPIIAICLRNSLDQAGYAIAKASGVTKPKRSYFPFAPNAAELENVIKRKCADLPPDIIALARRFKPYQGGNHLLCTINGLANMDKHRDIITLGINIQSMYAGEIKADGRVFFPPRWDSTKNEVVLAIADRNKPFKASLGISFYVAFGDIEGVKGHPIGDAITAMIRETESVVTALKAEAARLGIFS